MNFQYSNLVARKLLLHIHKAFSSKAILFTVVLIGLLSSIVILTLWVSTKEDPSSSTPQTAPNYQTVLPPNKTIDQLGGWQRVSPPDAAPAYAYIDTIENTRINVSQQLLPDDFMEDTDQRIEALAKGFSATTELVLEGGDRLYIGTSVRGPQSAIVIKNGLLILIKSEDKINDSAWKSYAESLK